MHTSKTSPASSSVQWLNAPALCCDAVFEFAVAMEAIDFELAPAKSVSGRCTHIDLPVLIHFRVEPTR